MSADPTSPRERLIDLLADKSLFGLSAAEEHELRYLQNKYPDVSDEDFEITAAAIQFAHVKDSISGEDELPANIRKLIEQTAQAPGMFDPSEEEPKQATSKTDSPRNSLNPQSASDSKVSDAEDSTVRPGFSSKERTREVIAWLFAAAAMIIALLGWIDRFDSAPTIRPSNVSLADQRQSLIDAQSDTQVIPWSIANANWTGGNDDIEVGDVVWSDKAQRGFMRFNGLAESDPDKVYQLWIFDAERDPRYPINGGTFTIRSSDSETIVPIDAELAVLDSVQFAITVEDAPGVVVSDRERLPLVAVVEPQP